MKNDNLKVFRLSVSRCNFFPRSIFFLLFFFSFPVFSFSQVGQVSFFLSTTGYCPENWANASGTIGDKDKILSDEHTTYYALISEAFTQEWQRAIVKASIDGFYLDLSDFYLRSSSLSSVYGSTMTDTIQGHGHVIYHMTGNYSPSLLYQDGRYSTFHLGAEGVASTGPVEPNSLAAYGTVRVSAETRPKTAVMLACVRVEPAVGDTYYIQSSTEVVYMSITSQDLKDFQNFLFVIFFFWLVISAFKLGR